MSGSGSTNSKESRSDWVYVGNVVFVELAVGVNENTALPRLLGFQIIPNRIMAKVVEDFQSQKETRGVNIRTPIEYGVVYNLRVAEMRTGMNRVIQILLL